MAVAKRFVFAILLVASSCVARAQSTPHISQLLVNGVVSHKGPVGARLTIEGTGFGATIGFSLATLDGIALAGAGEAPVLWSNTEIIAVIPEPVASGPVIVTVYNASGEHHSNSVYFAVDVAITGLSTTSGLAGSPVMIDGQGFGTSVGTVTFNGLPAAATGWTDTNIAVTVPTGATAGPIVVTVKGQKSNRVAFTPTPSISGLSPHWGDAGTEVTISGDSFGNPQSTSRITFGGIPAEARSWTNTSISALAPSGLSGIVEVLVTVNGVPSAGVTFIYTSELGLISRIPAWVDGI
jgi:IPT/TIG domain